MRGISLLGVPLLLFAGGLFAAGKYPYEKAPGPIAGSWKMSCESRGTMVVTVTADDHTAVGRISDLGTVGKYGYQVGVEILRLEADDFGDWVGKLLWRSISGDSHWDSIRMVATSNQLSATMTTDPCFRNLTRVP